MVVLHTWLGCLRANITGCYAAATFVGRAAVIEANGSTVCEASLTPTNAEHGVGLAAVTFLKSLVWSYQ